VCCPSKVPSLIISRHQQNIMNKIIQKPPCANAPPPLYPCMYIAVPTVSIKAESEATNGQGLGSTK